MKRLLARARVEGWDALLADVAAEIERTNASGAKAYLEGRYTEADTIRQQVQELVSFRDRLLALRKEWAELVMTRPPDPAPAATSARLDGEQPAPKFPTTQRGTTDGRTFLRPILQALVDLGGSAPRYLVLEKVEAAVRDQLTTKDLERSANPSHPVLWVRTVGGYSRQLLIERGWLQSSSPKGLWEITQAGRRALLEADT